VLWWVDYDGTTPVEPHPATTPDASTYEISDYDARARLVQFATDDIGAVRIGATLTERLDAPLVVRELVITVGGNENDAGMLNVTAWCSDADTARGRLLDAVRALIRRETAGRIFAPVRYRVGQMNGDRYELQIVRQASGLPNVIPCSAWPGLAGSHSIPADGGECLVQFIEGDPSQPIVTHFAGRDGVGWMPVEAIIAASSLVRLGSDTANRALALAAETNQNLETLRADLSGHTHGPGSFTTPSAGGGGGAVTGVSGAAASISTLPTVASTKVVTDG
jgi:hypothetical protein